ncbi:hypothetical protein A5886_000088 [Enterococcus sp. 8G7_MSG3316]|uniref:Uncharacterized protein n=1 Tax=Candidatus Enterococcus testudinis TaxID=1834191 RepID=A0A242A1Z5_9ENTE|nr:PTS cellbiose transporter subunit IIB [Enterococcus sp. 8G7_MSG3316]OTN75044.1 hypothetical protein A5886_000088 [Enterococcus sp. 8G7_MSG3316]
MTTIGLFCTTGLSTALLIQALKEQVGDQKAVAIHSAPFSEIFMSGKGCDYLLLAPHTRFNLEKVTAAFPDKKIVLLTEEEFRFRHLERIVKEINI